MNMPPYKNAGAVVILAFAFAMVACGGTSSTPPITPPPPAPTASLSANPSTIVQGASSTLTWQTTNATDVSINGLGAVQPNGSQSVNPGNSTTYTLTAKGAGGTQTAMATVTVTIPPPPSPSSFAITILQPLPGATESSAAAINDAGVVVGYSVFETNGQQSFEATMWVDGVPTDLGVGAATAINSSGQVVGIGAPGPPAGVDVSGIPWDGFGRKQLGEFSSAPSRMSGRIR